MIALSGPGWRPPSASWSDPGPQGASFTSKFFTLARLSVRLVRETRADGWSPRRRFLAVCARYQAGKASHVPAESFSQRCADVAVTRGLVPALGLLAWGTVLHLSRLERGGW